MASRSKGHTDLATSENIQARFESQGWSVQSIDGHDYAQIQKALQNATAASDKPRLICCKTTIAKGSPNKCNTHEAHGAPLGKEEVALTKQALGMPPDDFFVDNKVRAVFQQAAQRNEQARLRWQGEMEGWAAKAPEQAKAWQSFRERALPKDLLEQLAAAAGAEPAATRALSGNVIQRLAEIVPSFTSGSADLDPSTKTRIKKSGSFTAKDRTGRTLHFGIREHAMGAVLNGLTLHSGFLPSGSTFLVFTDYMRTPIRLAALHEDPDDVRVSRTTA
jgi:transketolase